MGLIQSVPERGLVTPMLILQCGTWKEGPPIDLVGPPTLPTAHRGAAGTDSQSRSSRSDYPNPITPNPEILPFPLMTV